MAHLRFFNPEYSEVTGAIKRAQQLVQSQYMYIEEHPNLAHSNFRRLRNIASLLKNMSQQHPARIDHNELDAILNELSSIIATMQSISDAAQQAVA